VITSYPALVERFLLAARRYPNSPALAEGNARWTYAELHLRSEAIAADVSSKLCGLSAPVAVLARHGPETIAALLGVLKAGATAVPLDPEMTPSALSDYLAASGATCVVEGDRVSALGVQGGLPTGNAPALIYFSSGSTGRPKPIRQSHTSVAFGIDAYARAMHLGPSDRVAWLTPMTFGASSSVIFGTLLHGACLVARDPRREEAGAIPVWIRRERISVVHTVPSVFRRFAARAEAGDLDSLRALKLGGEPVLASDLALFKAACPQGCVLVNGLGITEAGYNVTFFHATHDTHLVFPTVPVGRPIEGVRVRIVDEEGRDVLPGDPGEIVVRGEMLACGDVELRPGDRGRYLADGNLLHLGRVGDEVKIRGLRINLPGIESALRDVPGVDEAVAGVLETDTGEELVACCRTTMAPDEVRKHLAARWPSHLVPGRIVATDGDIPRLPTGKPDRTAVPALFAQKPERDHVPPRDAVEKQIVTIWERAFSRGPIGVRDNYFDLGGNSLIATTIAGGLERAFAVWFPLNTFVEHPTIESLAALVRSKAPRLTTRRAVLLQDGPCTDPIFCVPGAGSDVFALVDVARCFAAERPFYGLQHEGLDGEPQRHRTVEEIAEKFLPDIRAIQPDGPILLAGSSFGGIVAVELAQRLLAEGRDVVFVGLLDTYGPGALRVRKGLSLRRRCLVQLRRVLPLGRKEDLSWANFRAGVHEQLIRARARRALRREGGVVPASNEQFFFLQEVCFQARARYVHPPFARRLYLFRAEDGLPEIIYEPAPDRGWSALASGGLRIIPVPGAHGYHIRDPNASVLARALSGAIQESLAGGEDRLEQPAMVDRTRKAWDALAGWWDDAVGDAGNPRTSGVLAPATERLLGVRAGERVIDAGCGNGWFSRLAARHGARVFAFDFSPVFIRRAIARNGAASNPEFRVLDASRESDLAALGAGSYDAAVCTMALHDMAVIEPLIAALARAVRVGGRFVFSVLTPAADLASPVAERTLAMPGQPEPHISFHRPLSAVLDLCARHGWRHDVTEEMDLPDSGPKISIIRLVREKNVPDQSSHSTM